MLASNTILQNRYRVLRELGHGGMGTVYEALDQRVNCIVALKETSAGNNDEARAFEREASLLGNLRHSALPKVMDYFSEESGDFLVMEFIPGYDLAELLELRDSPFPQSQVLRWADELLKVLEYLHRQQPPVLHRDIKPSNLKLTKQGEIFLLDFGLAKGTAGQMRTLATSRSVHGYTPVYASLEQILGQGTDPRSDLYSLGATLYHLLTGVPPKDAPTRFNSIEDEQPDPLPPIEKLNAQCSASVAAIIHQAMAINRRQRPPGAAEMRKALRQAAEEDERGAAEEEYRRAEAKRQQRDAEQRKAKEAAARQAEEERQQQEAETRKAEEERRQQAERRQREEEARLRAEAERQRLEEAERQKREAEAAARIRAIEADRRRLEEARRAKKARVAEETNAEQERLRTREEASTRAEEETHQPRANLSLATPARTVRSQEPTASESPPAQPLVKTLKAPPPEKLFNQSQGRLDDRVFAPGESQTSRHARKRTALIVVAALISIAAVIFIVWLTQGTATQNQTSAESQPATPAPPVKQSPDKQQPPSGMVYVSGGTFMMGRDSGTDQAERPAHQITVVPFYIDLHEVTNEDYEKFVQATSHRAPMTWAGGAYPSDAARKPVTGVTWDDANAYARWAKKRLPTEEEWEFAARGTDGRLYPWGNDWQQGVANANGASQGMADVGSFRGISQFGAFDMIGNAWEWTASDLRAYPKGSLPADLPGGELKVIRGGSYESMKDYATTTYRTGWPARGAQTYAQTGFRCAADTASGGTERETGNGNSNTNTSAPRQTPSSRKTTNATDRVIKERVKRIMRPFRSMTINSGNPFSVLRECAERKDRRSQE